MASNYEEMKQQQRAWNPKTLGMLKANGYDISTHITIRNVYYPESKLLMIKLNKTLVDHGIEVVTAEEYMFEDRLCFRIETDSTIIPSVEALNTMTDQCGDYAREAGVAYDGWFAAP